MEELITTAKYNYLCLLALSAKADGEKVEAGITMIMVQLCLVNLHLLRNEWKASSPFACCNDRALDRKRPRNVIQNGSKQIV
jgi:hypothetical protein